MRNGFTLRMSHASLLGNFLSAPMASEYERTGKNDKQ